MAVNEGARKSGKFIVVNTIPDVCLTPPNPSPVPYSIVAYLDDSVDYSKNVNFTCQPAAMMKSRVSKVTGDEAGSAGGVSSGVNVGYCRPIKGKHSTTVRVNGEYVLYHSGLMDMNCAGPEGTGNTVGIICFLGLSCSAAISPGEEKQPCDPETPQEEIFLENLPDKVKECLKKKFENIFEKIKDAADIRKDFEKILDIISKTDWKDFRDAYKALDEIVDVFEEKFKGLKELEDIYKFVKNVRDLAKTLSGEGGADFSSTLNALGEIANVIDKGSELLGCKNFSLGNVADLIGLDQLAKTLGLHDFTFGDLAKLEDLISGLINSDLDDPASVISALGQIADIALLLNKNVKVIQNDCYRNLVSDNLQTIVSLAKIGSNLAYKLDNKDLSKPAVLIDIAGDVAMIAKFGVDFINDPYLKCLFSDTLKDIADIAYEASKLASKLSETNWKDPADVLDVLGDAAILVDSGIDKFVKDPYWSCLLNDLFKDIGKLSHTASKLADIVPKLAKIPDDVISIASEIEDIVSEIEHLDWSDPRAIVRTISHIVHVIERIVKIVELIDELVDLIKDLIEQIDKWRSKKCCAEKRAKNGCLVTKKSSESKAPPPKKKSPQRKRSPRKQTDWM